MTDPKIIELENRIIFLDNEIAILHGIIAQMDRRVKNKAKKDFSKLLELEYMKNDFWQSRPHERVDPFPNFDLVFWASYLLMNTERKEILNSIAEVAKRAHRIQAIVEYFKEKWLIKGIDTDKADTQARIDTKNYLEYVLLGVPTFETKKGTAPMTFWVATSAWAINNFAGKLATWQRDQKLKAFDNPLKEED